MQHYDNKVQLIKETHIYLEAHEMVKIDTTSWRDGVEGSASIKVLSFLLT